MINRSVRTSVLSTAALAALCWIPATASAIAAELWVATSGSDSNPGTQSAPFRTIQKAANVVWPGDTVRVRAGVYTQRVVTTRSGTANARIRFVSNVKWGAKITPTTPASRSDWVGSSAWLNRASYVDIDGFEIYPGPGGSLSWGINNDSGTNSRIRNNKIHDVKTFTSALAGSGVGNAGINEEISGNIIYNVGPAGDQLTHCIYETSGPSKIFNNITYNCSGFGIHLWHTPHHVHIINNTSFNNGMCGITVGAGEHSNSYATGCVVANNIAYKNKRCGIQTAGNLGSNVFVNNLAYGNPSNWGLSKGTHTGDVNADPKFMNYNPSGTGNYRLQSSSPAINKGSATYAPGTDIDGRSRPLGSAPDIGAYEIN